LTSPGPTLASFDYTVDGTGNRTAIAYADGSTSTYSFDNAYRLTGEERRDGAGKLIYAQTFEYDAVGNREKMMATNHVVAYHADLSTRGLWHLDEPADAETGVLVALDYSGNGSHLVGASGVSQAEGRLGKAVAFDGTGALACAD